MACLSTDESCDITLVVVVPQMDSWCVVSERMLVSILSISVDPRKIAWTEAALTLALLRGDLIPENLQFTPS